MLTKDVYQEGRRDGRDEIMSQMHDIIGKCYNTGYKDAMDFAIKWLQEKCSIEGRCIIKLDSFRKEMIENLCKGTSNSETEYTTNTSTEE